MKSTHEFVSCTFYVTYLQTVELEYKLKTAEQTLANRGTVAGKK